MASSTWTATAAPGSLTSAMTAVPAWEVNATAVVLPAARHISFTTEVMLAVCYVVGIAGNLAALVILVRGGRRAHRNARHSLMLRCLACNDLVALLGMLVMMEAQLRLPRELVRSRTFCALRVVWRLFGLGSGSVAFVMALERWLALTRPFLYQKHITYHVVKRAIFSMWGCVLCLVLLPLFGFGLYYDPTSKMCTRYPHATKPVDIAYAYVYFTFGMLLIASILCCNLLVVRGLHRAGQSARATLGRCRSADEGTALGTHLHPGAQCLERRWRRRRRRGWGLLRALLQARRGRPTTAAGAGLAPATPQEATVSMEQLQPSAIRRFSRQCTRLLHSESVDSATHEETAFAKLMGFLCVLFVMCWLPQMITIPLTQLWPTWSPGQKFSRLADVSLLLHFTLDPFVYVLQSCTRRHSAHSATTPAAIRGPARGPVPALQAGVGGAGSGPASAWPQPPYMRKLGASLRLCGATALCCSRPGGAQDRAAAVRFLPAATMTAAR